MLIETRKTLRCSSVTFCFLALLFQNFQKIGLNCIILISERVLIHIPKMHSTSCVINFQAALTKSFLLKNVCPTTTKKHAYFEDELHWFFNRTCYGFCESKMLRGPSINVTFLGNLSPPPPLTVWPPWGDATPTPPTRTQETCSNNIF